MQPVDHILEYYRTKLAWADGADWPHVHLREMVKHYETLNARTQLADQNRAILNAAEASRRENAVFHVAHVADYYRSINRVKLDCFCSPFFHSRGAALTSLGCRSFAREAQSFHHAHDCHCIPHVTAWRNVAVG